MQHVAAKISPSVYYPHRFRRLKGLDTLLRTCGIASIKWAAGKFGCSRRAIERDIAELEMRAGAHITRNGRKPYRYEGILAASPFGFDEADTFLLLLGQAALSQYRGTPFERPARQAYLKILRHTNLEQLDIPADCIHFDAGWITVHYDHSIFTALLNAFGCRETLRVAYRTARTGKACDRDIDIYHIAAVAGEWYAIGLDHLSKEIRTFHIARITSATGTGRNYEIPTSFNARSYLHQGFALIKGGTKERIRIRFSKAAAPYIQDKNWHPSQKLTPLKGGAVELKFTTDGLEAVKRWVLGFGGQAKVMGPEKLREMVRQEAETILKNNSTAHEYHTI